MPEKRCVQCGKPTEHVLLDTTGGKHEVIALCSQCMADRFGTPYDEQDDHPVKMPTAEVLDFVDCPECGAHGSVPLPVDRPEGAVVTAGPTRGVGRGFMLCQRCGTRVPFGVPIS
ncbi:MAG: hypothetical protein ACLQPH_17520 [Acidimicrobiales bacterium]